MGLVTNLTGPQGPQGIQGPPGDPTGAFADRYEIVSNTFFYRGHAAPGSLDSDAVWQIWAVTVTGLTAATTFASGDNNFNKVWDDRSMYTYS